MPRPVRVLAQLAATACLAVAVPALAAAPASAAEPVQTFSLAAGSRPEGIAEGPGGTYFAGSMADGSVYTGRLRTGSRRVLVPSEGDRAARGLDYDPRTRTIWVAGEQRLPDGTTASAVSQYDAFNGALLRRVPVPGARFLNDVEATPEAVYVTDSLSNQLTVVTDAGLTLLPVTGDFVQPPAGQNGLNGIVALAGGDLVVTDSSTGDLLRVDPATGVADRLEISGPDLVSGDGLERRGRMLYVVYGAGTDGIVAVRLSPDRRSGRVTRTLTDPDLDRPTTAVISGGALYAVNGRFGTAPTPTTPYDVVRVDLGQGS